MERKPDKETAVKTINLMEALKESIAQRDRDARAATHEMHEHEEDQEFDCHAMAEADGTVFCPAAGSEECDWHCPHGGSP